MNYSDIAIVISYADVVALPLADRWLRGLETAAQSRYARCLLVRGHAHVSRG